MNNQQYDFFLARISNIVHNLRNFVSFNQFETDWMNYYNNIYIPHSNNARPPRIFIAESAPSGVYVNNSNYIFHQNTLYNNVSDSTDMYLYRYYRGVFPNSTPIETRQKTKLQALIDLSAQNILIIDLLPTHGIKLETKDRININNNLLNLVDYYFLNSLNFPNHQIHYAFSVPPSLYTIQFCAPYLNDNFIEFGNVNIGQGHAPSIQAIQQIIQNGFLVYKPVANNV
jgi:hypothetical protein